jgi:hypothetical protein
MYFSAVYSLLIKYMYLYMCTCIYIMLRYIDMCSLTVVKKQYFTSIAVILSSIDYPDTTLTLMGAYYAATTCYFQSAKEAI